MEAPGRTLGSAYGGRAHEQSYSNPRGVASLHGGEYSFPGKVHAVDVWAGRADVEVTV